MKKINTFLLITSLLSVSLTACTNDDSNVVPIQMEYNYCTQEELNLRESPYRLFSNPNLWSLQYPSGTVNGGMKTTPITEDYKSKYFSLYKNENGNEYLRFSLDASDQGKSTNGSSVRAELSSTKSWTLTGKNALSYKFYLTSTDFSQARFTVGQFLQRCDSKDSPLCRIELENGSITAKVINYEKDGTTKADGTTHNYDMGTIRQNQEVSIKIALDAKTMTLWRDSKIMATHTFHQNVRSDYNNYFKAGIYYQNKDSPKIFSEIFMRDLEVTFD